MVFSFKDTKESWRSKQRASWRRQDHRTRTHVRLGGHPAKLISKRKLTSMTYTKDNGRTHRSMDMAPRSSITVIAIRATIKTANSTAKVSTPGRMDQSISASSTTATKLAWANGLSSILSQQASKELQFTKVASRTIANTDLEQSFGQQVEDMMDNLVKTKDMVMEKCSTAMGPPTKAIGQEDRKTASESRWAWVMVLRLASLDMMCSSRTRVFSLMGLLLVPMACYEGLISKLSSVGATPTLRHSSKEAKVCYQPPTLNCLLLRLVDPSQPSTTAKSFWTIERVIMRMRNWTS